MQLKIFAMLMVYMLYYLLVTAAVLVVVTTTTIITTEYSLWTRHCAQQTLYISFIIPKLHNDEVVLFLVLELEKLSFREAKHPGLLGYCPGLSRSVVLKCGPNPAGSASPGSLLETISSLAPDLMIQKLQEWALFNVFDAL